MNFGVKSAIRSVCQIISEGRHAILLGNGAAKAALVYDNSS